MRVSSRQCNPFLNVRPNAGVGNRSSSVLQKSCASASICLGSLPTGKANYLVNFSLDNLLTLVTEVGVGVVKNIVNTLTREKSI